MSGERPKHPREDDARALFIGGIAMLVLAVIMVVVGVMTGDSVWFPVAVFVGVWGLIYAAVGGALNEGER